MRHCDPLSTSQGGTFMARGGAFIWPCVSVSALFGFCAAALTARESDLQRSFCWTRLSLLLPPTLWLLSLGALCSSQFFAPYCQRLRDLLTTTTRRRHIRSCMHRKEQALSMNKYNCIEKCPALRDAGSN